MKLEKYLADYIGHEHELNPNVCFAYSQPDRSVSIELVSLQEIIQQGIEAFESTEGVKIHIDNAGDITDDSEEPE